jgi:bifunctional non-homologous end joining protein LigD
MNTTTLYLKDGRADKVYTASVDSTVVQFAWGRRGGTMQTKTETAATPGAAELLCHKKLSEKRAKGYTDGPDATPIVTPGFDPQASPAAGRAGLTLVPRPMLLNEIGDAELLQLARDADWCMQEKHDGNRILLRKSGARLTSYSRTGRETSALPKAIVEAAMSYPGDFLLDGEIVGDLIWGFDLLAWEEGETSALPYTLRLFHLTGIFGDSVSGIRIVQTASEPDEKLALFARVRKQGGEGVVLKRLSARYEAGRPNSGGPALRYKFIATITVRVASQNPQRSVNMQLEDGTHVGRVTIPPNHPLPPAGVLCEVRYLYAHRGSNSLSQAVYLGVRDDVEHADGPAQLKFKSEDAA